MPLAVLQMSDAPHIESLAMMLWSAGYEVKTCGREAQSHLRARDCDTVIGVGQMTAWGNDKVMLEVGDATLDDVKKCDVFFDTKVRNIPKILELWPMLKGKLGWIRVNGAQPEVCERGGDEVRLPCPIVTANLWYGTPRYYCDEKTTASQAQSIDEHEAGRAVTLQQLLNTCDTIVPNANGMAYTCWMPYRKREEYDKVDRSKIKSYAPPFTICHNVQGWGFGPILNRLRSELGVKLYGRGSPDGQISHRRVVALASTGAALVHLKSVDCPGWVLLECMLSGCPVITSRTLNGRMLAYDLLENYDTCMEFGPPPQMEYGRGDTGIEDCYNEIANGLQYLSDPAENLRIGENGRRRLNELMWNVERDGDSFKEWMERWYAC